MAPELRAFDQAFVRLSGMTPFLLFLKREDHLPVVLNVHDGPARGLRLIERLIEAADGAVAIVIPLVLGIGVLRSFRKQ